VKDIAAWGKRENLCSHKEAGSRLLARDEEHVKKMITTLTTVMTNPFDVEDANNSEFIPSMNLATGVVMPEGIRGQAT